MYLNNMSQHAQYRSAQRNLSEDDIDFIRAHGECERGAGVMFYQLHRKNIPNDTPGNHRHRQLVGTTLVVCSSCGEFIVTLYRQEKAFNRDRRKAKYNRKSNQTRLCPHCRALYEELGA